MSERDYYEILGIDKSASKEEIKKKYKKLALKYHPDRNQDEGAEAKFKEISEAYAVLSDGEKKQTYDQYGHAGFDQRYSQEDIFRGTNFDDVFSDIFGGGGGSIFDMFFGGRRQRRGSDLRYDLDINFKDAVFGITKTLKIPKMSKCKDCEGSGAENNELETCKTCEGAGKLRRNQRTPFGIFSQVGKCDECSGEGKIAKKKCKTCSGAGLKEEVKEIKVNIPKGVNTGNQIRVSNEGEEIKNGEAGDLYIFLRVKEHEFFDREGNDLLLDLPVTVSQATLGVEVKIPTLKEKVKIKIPSGTQSGSVLRLRGNGVEDLHGRGVGDLLVKIEVDIPKKLNKKQKKLFEELKKEEKDVSESFLEKMKKVFS
jgi:molecular chaperone DnaJ